MYFPARLSISPGLPLASLGLPGREWDEAKDTLWGGPLLGGGLRALGLSTGAGCKPQDSVLLLRSPLRAHGPRVAGQTRPAVWPSTARAQCCRLRVLGRAAGTDVGRLLNFSI